MIGDGTHIVFGNFGMALGGLDFSAKEAGKAILELLQGKSDVALTLEQMQEGQIACKQLERVSKLAVELLGQLKMLEDSWRTPKKGPLGAILAEFCNSAKGDLTGHRNVEVLKVTFGDGTVIEDDVSSWTFAKAIAKIGPGRIVSLGANSLMPSKDLFKINDGLPHNYWGSCFAVGEGYAVCTHSSNTFKLEALQDIGKSLQLPDFKVDIVSVLDVPVKSGKAKQAMPEWEKAVRHLDDSDYPVSKQPNKKQAGMVQQEELHFMPGS